MYSDDTVFFVIFVIWSSDGISGWSETLFHEIVHPFVKDMPLLSKVTRIFPSPSFTYIMPSASSNPPIFNTPPFIKLALIVPVVMKSATICPSCVIASAYGPLYPVDEYPSPPLFQRHTFDAVLISSVSIIRISSG